MFSCKGGYAKVKSFMHQVDDTLVQTMTTITDITGKIKAIEGDPTVMEIEAIIPKGSEYEATFNTAIDKLSTNVSTGLSVAERIVALLAGKTTDAKDGDLLKLASVATAVQDSRYTQHTYDTAVQVHIEGLK